MAKKPSRVIQNLERIKGLTWVPDLPDIRDHIFKPKAVLLPLRTNNRLFAPPIQDQGQTSSCTGNAIASMVELEDLRKRHVDASRLFIYTVERLYINELHMDDGAYIRDGIKAIAEFGWALESMWPFNLKKLHKKPPPFVYKDAAKRKIKEYQRVEGATPADFTFNIKSALAAGHPIVFGVPVYDSFMSLPSSGLVRMPKSTENMLGGHAMLLVDYDDIMGYYPTANSWGLEWGDKGWCYIPYEYIEKMAEDCWIIRL